MKHRESRFDNTRGQSIYTQRWAPENTPKAAILLVHGLAEHSSRYRDFGGFLVERGYALCALDLPGHGKSDGRPGFIARFSHYLDTVNRYLETLQTDYPNQPLILFGHSMGGLVSSRLLLDNQRAFHGAVLTGPAINSPNQPPALQLLIIRLLSLLAPKLGVISLDSSEVSRDPQVVEDYKNDPLVYNGKISARSVAELFAAMEYVKANAGAIDLPILLMHGEADVMTCPTGSRFLHDQVSSADRTLSIYQGLRHEILNEPEKLTVYSEIADWLDRLTEANQNRQSAAKSDCV